jgi:hypothetical protein
MNVTTRAETYHALLIEQENERQCFALSNPASAAEFQYDLAWRELERAQAECARRLALPRARWLAAEQRLRASLATDETERKQHEAEAVRILQEAEAAAAVDSTT